MKKILSIIFLLLIVVIVFLLIKDKSVWEKGLKGINQSIINQKIKNQEIDNQSQQSDLSQTTINEEIKQGEIFLEILSPDNNSVVNNPLITISGRTIAYADVFINDKETKADNQGNFSLNYNLEEGENELMIVVNDSQGNYLEKTLIITYQLQ